jgi:hypothetical protein
MADNTLVYALNKSVTAPGSLGIGTIKDEGNIRIITAGAGLSNVIRVRARITGQQSWVTISDITGNDNQLLDVLGYDQLEVICLVFSALNGIELKVLASSFNGTSLFLSTDDGILDGASTIHFVSSNNTVDISANELTGELDFRVTGSSNPPSVTSFIVGDWVSDSGDYSITVLESSHIKGINPTVQVFEDNGIEFEEVEVLIELNNNGDTKILVPQSPDLRFAGKIIIS